MNAKTFLKFTIKIKFILFLYYIYIYIFYFFFIYCVKQTISESLKTNSSEKQNHIWFVWREFILDDMCTVLLYFLSFLLFFVENKPQSILRFYF